ncbi:MAG: restriction endonuclease subunit S [Betaproteobacteria bacterium]|nr:restriction endonuclease subunit S [Betaproteobacteria bacterium]
MPDEETRQGWRWSLLSELARLETGHTPSRRHPEYWNGVIPWIGIRDATANHGRTLLDTEQHVTQAGIDNSSARLLPANTVCLSRTASVGYVVVMGRPMATSQDFVNWVCNPEALDYRYLKYALLAERTSYSRFSHGTTHQTIYFPEVKAFHLCAPAKAAQTAIADVLTALDDKIENNRRTAWALERLARAIFRAWFVDFEPIKAKAGGATSFPSMPQAVFDALPTRFINSEIGPVPEGWEMKSIGDVVSVKGGATPSTKSPEYWDGGTHCWATPKDMSRLSHPVLLDTERHITDAGINGISSGLLPPGTVLLSSRAPVGYLAIAGVPTAINQGFIAMVCDGPLPPTYVLQWTYASMDAIHGRASGTTFPEISKTNFRPLPVVVPTPEVVAAFRGLADPLFDLLTATVKEDCSLAATRDYLLPRLLSGSVRVEPVNG